MDDQTTGGGTVTTPEESSHPQTEFEPVTAWHPMLVALLDAFLPSGYELIPELLLTRLPLRLDILIVRKLEEAAGQPKKIHSILDYLSLHTVIEHKGPTDVLSGEDALVLLAYATQYMRLRKVKEPLDVRLMVVADRISGVFVKQLERHGGTFERFAQGLWRGQVAGFQLHGVETGEAFKRGPTERLLYAFSRAFLERPADLAPLEREDEMVYLALYQQVEQFRKTRGDMAMKDIEELRKAAEQYKADMIAELTLEQRLAGLTPEQRLRGLTPEQLLQGLTPEQRLQGLTPEQVAALFDRLSQRTPERSSKKSSS